MFPNPVVVEVLEPNNGLFCVVAVDPNILVVGVEVVVWPNIDVVGLFCAPNKPLPIKQKIHNPLSFMLKLLFIYLYYLLMHPIQNQ